MAPILSRLQCDPQVATCLRKSWLFVRQWPFIDVCNVWNSDKMAAILKTTFPMLFLDRTVLYFDSNFTEVCPWSVLGNDMWLVMGEKKWLVATEQTTNPFPERILIYKPASTRPWWRHRMETFSVVLVLCVGNSPVTDEFPSQKPMTRSVFFDLRLNKRLSKQSWGRWFETPSHSLWRHCNTRWFLVKSPPIHAPPGELVMSFHVLFRVKIEYQGAVAILMHCITVTSYWAWWCFKSPASRLCTQPFVQAQIKENIKSSASLAFVRGIHRWPVNSPRKVTVTRKMFPFDDVIMESLKKVTGILKTTPFDAFSSKIFYLFIVRRAGLLWSQQDFEWLWSVPLSSASLY